MGKMEVGVMMSVGWTLDQLTQIRDLGFTNAQIAAPPKTFWRTRPTARP